MLRSFIIILVLALVFPALCHASRGFSIGLGTEYSPISSVEFGNPDVLRYEIYDNLSIESGLYYNYGSGFRTGAIISIFSKSVNTGNTDSDISSWGIGVLGDYEFEITESGGTRLVFGMDTGYSKFKENSYTNRNDESYWAAFFGGVRYFFSTRYFFEFDYRMKWQEFDLLGIPATGIPDKTYKFSGSSLRLALGYGFFSDDNSAER
jgi:hypothetical protein